MDCHFSSASAIGSHREGLHLQSCHLIFHRRPSFSLSSSCQKACSTKPSSQRLSVKGPVRAPLFPPRPWVKACPRSPPLVLSSSVVSIGSRIFQPPWPSFRPGDSQASSGSLVPQTMLPHPRSRAPGLPYVQHPPVDCVGVSLVNSPSPASLSRQVLWQS